MASIAVALLPSNQDRNKSPVRPEYNEYGGQHWLAPLIEEKCRALGINAKWFPTGAESSDGYHLENLIKQQNAANAWLAQQGEQLRALVNFHTDSGKDNSHTYAIYGTQNPDSKRLAEAIGPLVHDALGTTNYQALSEIGDVNYSGYVFAHLAKFPACLIEECSHESAQDMNNLFARPQQLAAAIAQGIANYAGLTSEINWQAEADKWRQQYQAQAAIVGGYKQRLDQIAKLAMG